MDTIVTDQPTPPSWALYEGEKVKQIEVHCAYCSAGKERRADWWVSYHGTLSKALEVAAQFEKRGYKRGKDCEHCKINQTQAP